MKKDLQSEYQNMIRADLPDLWGRIESGLDAREAQKEKKEQKKKPEVQATEIHRSETETGKEAKTESPVKKGKIFRWQYIALPVAAVLCAALILPVVLNVRKAERNASTAMRGEYSEESAAESIAETVTVDSAADGTAEVMQEAVAEEEFGMTESTSAYETDKESVVANAVKSEWDTVDSQGAGIEKAEMSEAEEQAILDEAYEGGLLTLYVTEEATEEEVEALAEENGLCIVSYRPRYQYYVLGIGDADEESREALIRTLMESELVTDCR